MPRYFSSKAAALFHPGLVLRLMILMTFSSFCQGGAFLHPLPLPRPFPLALFAAQARQWARGRSLGFRAGARALHLELLRGQRHLVHPRESYNFVIDL